MTRKALGRVLVCAASTWLPAAQPRALTPLVEIRVSPDITVTLDTTVVNDEEVGVDNLAGTVTLQSIGAIPPEADLDAYNVLPNGDQLLSFDTTVVLPGGVTARPADVVRYDGVDYSIEFDAASHGIPDGVNVDAVAVYGGSLLLSFDVAVDLNGLHVDNEDLVLFDGATFSMFFDGSAAGMNPGLDLDAADYLACNDHLFLSFDGSGSIGGIAFDDEDVLEFDRVGTWEMAYDASMHHASLSAADLDAVHATVDLGSGPPVVLGQTGRRQQGGCPVAKSGRLQGRARLVRFVCRHRRVQSQLHHIGNWDALLRSFAARRRNGLLVPRQTGWMYPEQLAIDVGRRARPRRRNSLTIVGVERPHLLGGEPHHVRRAKVR